MRQPFSKLQYTLWIPYCLYAPPPPPHHYTNNVAEMLEEPAAVSTPDGAADIFFPHIFFCLKENNSRLVYWVKVICFWPRKYHGVC